MNILCSGGPIAAAERVAACCALHGCEPEERRRIHVGFSAGRFEFMNRAYGIGPRSPVEEAAWPALKGQVFREAAHIFLRLLRGDILSSEDLPETVLSCSSFRSPADWERVLAAHGRRVEQLLIPRRFTFEELKIVPQDWRRELLQLVVGSHDPALQEEVNTLLPVQVFNLSITAPEVLEDTHQRMARAFHPGGGRWRRAFLPRTVMVFINPDPARARAQAARALSEYWKALEGTVDPLKVARATENALVGTPEQVCAQARARFHPEDRLMLWFDFYQHDPKQVIRGMELFAAEVAPRLNE